MSQHTPGKWTSLQHFHLGEPTQYRYVQFGDEDELYTTSPILPADANLIAAAPDLLDACRKVYAHLSQTYSPGNMAHMTLLALTIAKAEGQEVAK